MDDRTEQERGLQPLTGVCTLLYSTLLYSTLLYSTLLYSTLLYSTLLYSTLLYSTLLYSTLHSLIVQPPPPLGEQGHPEVTLRLDRLLSFPLLQEVAGLQ